MMSNMFFNPPELGVLYALTQLDGDHRYEALNVGGRCYENLDEANNWVKHIANDLHACYIAGHPAFEQFGQRAYDTLFEMWSIMTGEGMEHYPYPATVSWYKPPVSNIHITEDPIANFIREYRPRGFCRRINVVAENWIYGARFIRDLAIEFSMQQTGSTGRGIDIFAIAPFNQENRYHAQVFTRTGMWNGLAQEISSDTYGKSFDPPIVHTPPAVFDIPTLINTRGYMPRRLVVVDISDLDFPINACTWLINYFDATAPQSTVVFLTSEHIPFDGQVFTF